MPHEVSQESSDVSIIHEGGKDSPKEKETPKQVRMSMANIKSQISGSTHADGGDITKNASNVLLGSKNASNAL